MHFLGPDSGGGTGGQHLFRHHVSYFHSLWSDQGDLHLLSLNVYWWHLCGTAKTTGHELGERFGQTKAQVHMPQERAQAQ